MTHALAFHPAPIALVRIPRGRFLMGSTNTLFGEAPVREVLVDRAFDLGRTPVTRAQWHAVMGDDPSGAGDQDDCPVDGVSWDRASAFCAALTERCGRRVHLPSEAQWEYACRAGTSGDYYFSECGPYSDDSEVPLALQRRLCEHAWFERNSRGRTHPVGRLAPNPWGLHDLIGNVWEWCEDDWYDDAHGAPTDDSPRRDPLAPRERRCLRGGAWDTTAFRCRSAYRSQDHRGFATARFGLRIAVEV